MYRDDDYDISMAYKKRAFIDLSEFNSYEHGLA